MSSWSIAFNTTITGHSFKTFLLPMINGIFLSLSECCLVWLLGVDWTPLLLASNFTCQQFYLPEWPCCRCRLLGCLLFTDWCQLVGSRCLRPLEDVPPLCDSMLGWLPEAASAFILLTSATKLSPVSRERSWFRSSSFAATAPLGTLFPPGIAYVHTNRSRLL